MNLYATDPRRVSLTTRIRLAVRRVLDAHHAHYLDKIADVPEGCCQCGTGGPYYRGEQTPVVRYLYVGACRGNNGTDIDWSSCSQHGGHDDEALILDYGQDLPKTIGECRADVAAVFAAHCGQAGWPLLPECQYRNHPKRHTHPTPKAK